MGKVAAAEGGAAPLVTVCVDTGVPPDGTVPGKAATSLSQWRVSEVVAPELYGSDRVGVTLCGVAVSVAEPPIGISRWRPTTLW